MTDYAMISLITLGWLMATSGIFLLGVAAILWVFRWPR